MTPFREALCLSTSSTAQRLCSEGIRKVLHVLLQTSVICQEFDISTIHLHTAALLPVNVFLTAERGEAPVLGYDNLLAAGEFVLGATECLKGDGAVFDLKLATINPSKQVYCTIYVLESRVRTLMIIWPMLTRATVPLGLPQAPRIPV